jgi:N-acetylglucosaminyldiphosphoundecaprenol N-acetyl-beta-D-mannosaminyltransferase
MTGPGVRSARRWWPRIFLAGHVSTENSKLGCGTAAARVNVCCSSRLTVLLGQRKNYWRAPALVSYSRYCVLGVPVDTATSSDVLDFVRDRVAARDPARIVTVNAEFVMLSRRNRRFREAVASADLATADGAGVVWALRRQGATLPGRAGGSDLIWSLSEHAARLGHRVFLLGGADGIARKTGERLAERYPGLEVAGAYGGSPRPSEREAIVNLVRETKADILFVAFGAPDQDIWIAENLPATGVSVAMGVGGSFDYVAGVARRAPRWMQDHGLDWLWRLAREPWRWKRMTVLSTFVWLVLRTRPLPQKGSRS